MLTLVLDTAYNLKVTLIDDKKIISSSMSEDKKADKYMQMIDQTLKSAGKNVSDIDRLAVNIGPGSFTGIRVTVAVAKGLFFNSKAKFFTFTSFDEVANPENKVIVLPGFSDFVYVKYQNEKMDCIKIEELKKFKFITNSDEVFNKLKEQNINVELAESESIFKIIDKAKNIKYLKDFKPLYLRKSQAELNLQEKKKV